MHKKRTRLLSLLLVGALLLGLYPLPGLAYADRHNRIATGERSSAKHGTGYWISAASSGF